MDIINCRMCGKIFRSGGSKVCPVCVEEMEKQLLVIRDYIDEHPDANVSEVSEATDIDEKVILEFIRDSRLELKDEGVGLPCERCGTPIRTGRMCDDCVREFEREMKKGLAGSPAPSADRVRAGDRMFVADRHRRR